MQNGHTDEVNGDGNGADDDDTEAPSSSSSSELEDEKARADKLAAELEALRKELAGSQASVELAKLRSELEEERELHETTRVEAERRVKEIQEAKEGVDAQYSALLGRVSTIRTTLGERMKADAVS
jgi:dsDNA-specific endonuclease/ATPase MutS2